LGLHADSLIRENARRERGLCLAGLQTRIWLSEKQLLNLRCHRITMVQATESRKGLNLPFTRSANFCKRLRCRSFRMITCSSKSRRQLPTQLSATPFCHGLPRAVRVGLLPISLAAETTLAPNFASRSSSKNLCGCWWAHASRNCYMIPSALGFRVTLKCKILRRSWLITKKQNKTPNVSVGTVKKSIAAMASQWFLRNVSHRFTGSGSLGARRIHRETLLSETSKPSYQKFAVNARRSPGRILGNHPKDQGANLFADTLLLPV
jgi:hypothetical protein